MAVLFSETSETSAGSPDICSSILFYSFSFLLQLFLLLNLPCCTSSLLLFAVCTYKGAHSVIHSAAQPLLVYARAHRYNSFFHYFFLNLVINGLRFSNVALSSTYCHRFQQTVHFPLHLLLFVCLFGLESISIKIQLFYNNRLISGLSI